MTTAEQWYNYEAEHQKYEVGGAFEQPLQNEKVKSARKRSGVSAKDRIKPVLVILIVGMAFVGIIIANAYAASIKYGINNIAEQNETLRGDIDTLTVEIHSANNIETIESKALKDLGMVEPDSKHCVYLTE